jgi:hypothetical protein
MLRRKGAEYEQELLKDITLGEVAVDLLPVKRSETPFEWQPAQQVYVLEARLDVAPAKGLVPESVTMKIILDSGSPARVLDAFPRSEIEMSAAEVREGGFVQASSTELTAGLKAQAEGVGANLGAKSAESIETSEKVTTTRNLVAQRIISATREHLARWEVLRTAEQSPVGGLMFFVTVLADTSCESLGVTASALVEFEGWGETPAERKRQLPLPAPR